MMRPQRSTPGQHRWLSTWARRALTLYPRAWRERYAEEMAAIFDDYPTTPRTLFDLLFGAFDAHLHADALLGRTTAMANRLRSSEIAIFVAFVVFCLAWFPLHFVSDTPSTWQSASQSHPAIAFALTMLNLSGLVALCAVLIGGLPVLASAISTAVARRQWATLALFALPVIAALALMGALLAMMQPSALRQAGASGAPTTLLEIALRLALALIALLTIGGSVVAIGVAVGRSEIGLRVARFALILAAVATAAMAVGTVAGATLITLIITQAQKQLGAWPPIEALMVALLLVAATLAGVGLWRGGQAARHNATTAAD